MKTIVVGYDETEPAKRALERAVDLAAKYGSKIVVTSVAPVLLAAGGRSSGPIDPTDTPAMHAEELAHARAFLGEREIEADYVTAVGEPADTIVELAEKRDADLIVVGTRELGIVGRLLGQSVSQSVARQAHCDVLIVH